MQISENAKKPVSIRVVTAVFLVLLAAASIIGYLGYSALMKLQDNQNTLQSQYDELVSQQVALQESFSEQLKNYSDLQDRYTNLQSQLSTLQNQQDTLQANHSALQNQYSMLQANQSSLESQNDVLESGYSALQAQHNILQGDYSALQAQYDMLQADYSSLQANYTEFVADYEQLRSNPFSYILFTDGNGNYFAENGTTRKIDYSGTDLAAILNAVIAPGKTCYFLPGEYHLESTVNVFDKNDVSLYGSGLETSIIQVPSDICAFNVTGTDPNVHNTRFIMSNLAINSTTSSTQPALFIKNVNDVKLSDISIIQFSTGYDFECTEKVYLYRCKVWSNKTSFSTGFKFVGYSIDTFLIDTLALHNQPSAVSYSFTDCDGITLINAIANPTVVSYGEGGYGFFFVNCHWVNLLGTISDGNGSHGYYLSGGFRYYFNGAWAGSNYGNGLQSDSAGHLMLSGCSFYTNRMDGIKLDNSGSTTISTVISTGNTRHGLEVSNTNGITVTASILTENGSKGIFFDLGNSNAIIQNNNCKGNFDSIYDIFIITPQSGATSLVSDNFGRTFQTH